jgi:hypothetical protein
MYGSVSHRPAQSAKKGAGVRCEADSRPAHGTHVTARQLSYADASVGPPLESEMRPTTATTHQVHLSPAKLFSIQTGAG